MKAIFLEDLKNLTELQIKKHIATEYSDEYSTDPDKLLLKELKEYNILIAYESVGSWGCDSSSFFLIQNKNLGLLSYV